MTSTKNAFKPKRINDMHWSGVSEVSKSIQDNVQNKQKIPMFYLHNESINNYEDDIYFVNNSNETLSFVAPYELMKRDSNNPKVVTVAEPSERDKAYTYTDVLPKQGVRIDRQHLIYDSDYLNQIIVYTMSRANKEMWGVWRLNVCEKGLFSSSYPLLFEGGTKPSLVVSAEKLNDPKDRSILPTILPIRQQLYQQWTDHYDHKCASFMISITDVIYRYDFGVVGCYFNHMWDEYSSEAEQIANRLIKNDADSVDDVLAMMTKVYDSSFGAGYTTVPKEVAEIIYGLWLRLGIGHKNTVNK